MTEDTPSLDILPNIDPAHLGAIDETALFDAPRSSHRPRILMLYGSLRERSYSRLATEEAARILRRLGAEVRIFDPAGLPLPDAVPADHPKVKELRDLSIWSEGQVWCSPERHGSMTGIMKAQIDWLPLSLGCQIACNRDPHFAPNNDPSRGALTDGLGRDVGRQSG